MTVTVSAWLEALETTSGRWRTLRRLRLPPDDRGEPAFASPANGLVDFDVEADGERLTLRCPLRSGEAFATRLRAFAERDSGLGGRFFTEWRVLEREAVIFGTDGEPREMDLLARPAPRGVPLTDFLGAAMARGDWNAVRRASESFEELARWAAGIPRLVSRKRLVVTPEGEMTVVAFSSADGTAHIREVLRDARRRMDIREPRVPLAAPDRTAEPHDSAVSGGGTGKTTGMEMNEVMDGTADGGAMFRDATGPAPHFAADYEEATWDAEWGVAVVMSEGKWSLLDCHGVTISVREYDWLGECSEGLLLAVREGRCGFIDTAGDEVIPCVWDDATSFADGVALVGSGDENFFINQRGERI